MVRFVHPQSFMARQSPIATRCSLLEVWTAPLGASMSEQREARTEGACSIAPPSRRLVADRVHAPLSGADPDHLADREHEEQPVARLARVGRGDDRLHRPVGHLGGDDALHLELRQQADVRLRAAVMLGVTLLAPAPLDLGHVEAAHPDLVERVLDILEALISDYRLDLVDLRHLCVHRSFSSARESGFRRGAHGMPSAAPNPTGAGRGAGRCAGGAGWWYS